MSLARKAVMLSFGGCIACSSVDPGGIGKPTTASFQGCRDEDFDWRSRGPMDLLEHLKSVEGFEICAVQANWVRDEDVPKLMALLDSQEPCGPVRLIVSSYLGAQSTIGNEAAFMVLGYREGRYPPDLNSNQRPVDQEEIKAWWNSRLQP